ncbi:MAG: hypothetical protein HY687_02250 [Chloroflexi bacterium]|nr:hypothetical protein [Chloroflexota bacterium]
MSTTAYTFQCPHCQNTIEWSLAEHSPLVTKSICGFCGVALLVDRARDTVHASKAPVQNASTFTKGSKENEQSDREWFFRSWMEQERLVHSD